MNDPLPDPDRPIDRLVRARLERDADPDRAAELWRRVARPPGRVLRWVPRVAAAAAVLLVTGMILWPGGQARATEVLAHAYAVHSRDDADRLYRLEVELPAAFQARFPRLNGHAADVWTRGDRFRVEPGLVGGAWGQDAEGRVWLAPSPKAGARFDADEIPEPLRVAMKVRAVDLPGLLAELRGRCDLTLKPGRPGVYHVEASRKDEADTLTRAAIVLDARTNTVHALDLWRELPGGEEAHLKLVLQETGSRPDGYYELEGNLAPGAEVLDRSRPGRRLALLARHGLGPLLGK